MGRHKTAFDELMDAKIKDAGDIEELIIKSGKLGAFIEEKFAWAYIKMTCDTENKEYALVFNNLAGNISPKWKSIF